MSLASFSLAGKAAIVTGGTGVLGGALARGLAAAGARVGILGRRAEQAARVASAITSAGGAALPVTADVRDRAGLLRRRSEPRVAAERRRYAHAARPADRRSHAASALRRAG